MSNFLQPANFKPHHSDKQILTQRVIHVSVSVASFMAL